jgi:photosystem II PsbU protein
MRTCLLAVAAAFNVPAPMAQAPVAVNGLVHVQQQPALRGAVVLQGAPAQSQGVDFTFLSLGFSLGFLGTWGLRQATLSVSGEEQSPALSRREALAKALGATAFLGAAAANADIDYAGVGYLGGSTTIDVNNSNIRVYQKLPGMYPNAAGKVVTNAPYKNKDDMYAKAKFTAKEAEFVKKYDSRFIYLEPRPEYIIDNINNGLYR